MIRDGWYVTGDIAKIDKHGFIEITGRLSRFSKIGGEMVPHLNVEEAIQQFVQGDNQDELLVVVTSVPDEKKGERLVVVHKKMDKTPQEICDHLKQSGLPNLWIPDPASFLEVEEIPVLGTGKLDLKGLADLAKTHFCLVELSRKAASRQGAKAQRKRRKGENAFAFPLCVFAPLRETDRRIRSSSSTSRSGCRISVTDSRRYVSSIGPSRVMLSFCSKKSNLRITLAMLGSSPSTSLIVFLSSSRGVGRRRRHQHRAPSWRTGRCRRPTPGCRRRCRCSSPRTPRRRSSGRTARGSRRLRSTSPRRPARPAASSPPRGSRR